MTLIESALRKMQQSAQRAAVEPAKPANAARRAQTRSTDAPKLEPEHTFLPSTLDVEAMERSCALPQVTDDRALRGYKILRSRLLQRMSTGNLQSLAVTGTDVAQGKTLTATNLAFALAQDPATSVFLVDLDLRRPRVAQALGMQFNYGLSDYLAGAASIDQIIYESGIPRLAIVPNGSVVPNSSEQLTSPRMAALLHTLTAAVPRRIVVYDMPPVMMSDDVIVFVPQVDGVLLVVSECFTERAMIEKAREVLGEMNILGVVLNRSRETNDASYY
jgi:protein-tyrosine kinase